MKSEYFGEITDNLRWCFAFYNFNSMINSCGCILCHNGFWWITMRDFVLLLNELWSFLGGCKYSTLFRCFNDQILTSIIIPSRYSVDRSASHPANPITLNNESNFANLSEQLHTQNMSSRATFFVGTFEMSRQKSIRMLLNDHRRSTATNIIRTKKMKRKTSFAPE